MISIPSTWKQVQEVIWRRELILLKERSIVLPWKNLVHVMFSLIKWLNFKFWYAQYLRSVFWPFRIISLLFLEEATQYSVQMTKFTSLAHSILSWLDVNHSLLFILLSLLFQWQVVFFYFSQREYVLSIYSWSCQVSENVW